MKKVFFFKFLKLFLELWRLMNVKSSRL